LDGFGTRIDIRSYPAVRDNVIRNRKIGYRYIGDLIYEICKLVSITGCDKIIAYKLECRLNEIENNISLLSFFGDAQQTIKVISNEYDLGIIDNQAGSILHLLEQSDISRFFKVIIISSEIDMQKLNPKMRQIAMESVVCEPEDYFIVGIGLIQILVLQINLE
jgi:hypothetical protein